MEVNCNHSTRLMQRGGGNYHARSVYYFLEAIFWQHAVHAYVYNIILLVRGRRSLLVLLVKTWHYTTEEFVEGTEHGQSILYLALHTTKKSSLIFMVKLLFRSYGKKSSGSMGRNLQGTLLLNETLHKYE